MHRNAAPLLVTITVIAAGLVGVPHSSLARTQGEASGEVVFRLTLEGPVDADHTFAIRCGSELFSCFGPEDIWILCSPPNEIYPYEPCEAGSYEVRTTPIAGDTLSYAVLRWTSPDLSHTDTQPEDHLAGEWVVQTGRQVVALGYVYPDAASPLLPDTATAP